MSRTVLVVDGDVDLRSALEEVLVDAGYDVVLARSGEHALELLETVVRPCLVLLDHTMPGGDAEKVLTAIQALADVESFVVVLMTGRRGLPLRSGTRVIAMLPKPFEMDALLVLLDEHCGAATSRAVAS